MRRKGDRRRVLKFGGWWFAAIAMLLAGGTVGAGARSGRQAAGVNQGGPGYIHAPAGMSPMPQPGMTEEQQRTEAMRQAERHRRIQADAAKLQQLSNELKDELDKTASNQLPVDAMRKTAEIEKVAHDLDSWLKS